MLLTWTSIAALAHLAAASVLAAHEPRVAVDPQTCVEFEKFIGAHDNTLSFGPGCADVTFACLKENGTSIWSHQACVAAATCQGVRPLCSLGTGNPCEADGSYTLSVITLNQCQNPNVLTASAIPNLSFAIYTNIVGSCASSGCPITQQNYIDFIYGAMSAANVTQWPSSVNEVITNWWNPILAWTATGDSIPYTNFNDWLHFSTS